MDLAIVMKILSPIAGKGAAAIAPTLVRSWLVAFNACRQARKAGLRVKYFSLRSIIAKHQVFDLFNKRATDEMVELAPILASCIVGPVPDDEQKLMEILAAAYVSSLPPSQAVRLESQTTRDHVSLEVSMLREEAGDHRGFEANCNMLNPIRAEEARHIQGSWPELARVVSAIVTATDRSQLFYDWTAHKPVWMIDAPVSVLCWLASAAQDYGALAATRTLLFEAIEAGATPRDYWIAKSAWVSQATKEQSEELLRPALSHPFAAALWHDLQGEHAIAINKMESWHPTSKDDLATKSLIMAQLFSVNDLDRAITTAISGYEAHDSAGCALFAAKSLVGRGAARNRPRFMNDITRGLELATKARDSRRRWGGDSAPAILTMITAYRTLGSTEDAWRCGRAAPEGTATPGEAADVRVISELARTAAELGMVERARALLPSLADGLERDEVEARIIEAESGFEKAAPLWTRLLATTTDPTDALNIGFRLAHHGTKIDWPVWVSASYKDDVADIDLISDLFREVEGSLPKARTRAASSPQVFHGLMTFQLSRQNYSAAAELAEESGRRRNDPESWLRAAEIHLTAGDQDHAAYAAEQAVRVGGSGWLRQPDARKILIEVLSSRGRWDQGLIEAGRLLEIRPQDVSAKWAFISCQFMTGDYRGAWDSYLDLDKPTPETADVARIWIQLHSQFASSLEHIDEAAGIAQQWPDDEPLRASILSSVFQSNAESATEAETAQIRKLRDAFFEDFPDSTHARMITVDSSDPIGSIREILEQLADRDETLQPVFTGDMPFGMVTEVTGKSYAEACLVRGAGKLFAGNLTTLEVEVAEVLHSFDGKVVLDTSVLATLAILGETAKDWPGLFSAGIIPTWSIHDAQRAVASLSSLSTATLGVDKSSGRPRMNEISETEAKTRLARATTLLTVGHGLTATTHPEIVSLPEIKSTEKDLQWLLPMDLAKTQGMAFWCDDRLLRSAAAGLGMQTFGTLALLEALRRTENVSLEIVQIAEARLIHHYYVGGSFEPQVMELAAEMDAWLPRGMAAAISETGPTPTPDKQISLVLRALHQCSGDPEAVQGWVAAIAYWLDAVSPDATTTHENLQFWFSKLLQQTWLNSSSLPYVLAGLRSTKSDKVDLERVVPVVIGHFYEQIADKTNPAVAVEYVRELISLTPDEDRSGVLRRIISV